jgi:hypothetical protein
MTDIADTIADEALKPASVSNDGVTVSRRSLSELIAYQKFLQANEAAADPTLALQSMTRRIVPPGGH